MSGALTRHEKTTRILCKEDGPPGVSERQSSLHKTLVVSKEESMAASNNKGFKISLDPTRHLLRVRAWGFWDAEFAKKYKSALTEKIEELCVHGEEWYALVDFTAFFYPRSTDVQRIISTQIASADRQGMKKIAYLEKRSVVQLLLNRLFRERDPQRHAFFESEEQALHWLLNESR